MPKDQKDLFTAKLLPDESQIAELNELYGTYRKAYNTALGELKAAFVACLALPGAEEIRENFCEINSQWVSSVPQDIIKNGIEDAVADYNELPLEEKACFEEHLKRKKSKEQTSGPIVICDDFPVSIDEKTNKIILKFRQYSFFIDEINFETEEEKVNYKKVLKNANTVSFERRNKCDYIIFN